MRPLVVLGCCVAWFGLSQAHAAEERARPVLEEIIVTATKRQESLQDVPIAVTAVDAQTLSRAGVKDLRDLPTLAAAFNMNSSQTESQGSTMRIRGVGTTGNNIGLESAVGVFLDGVYLSRPGIALGDLMDVEAIEVLRGPQGTLFGRNTTAGALNIRTRAPNLSQHEAFASLGAGNFDAYNVQAGVSGPLVPERLGYRLSGAVRKHDGFVESTSGAESLDRDRWQLRGQLLWSISDTADLRIIADYAEADEHCCDAAVIQESPAVALGSFAAAGLPAHGGVLTSGLKDAVEDRDSNGSQFENPFEQKGISAELNVDLTDTMRLTYIGAWRDFRADSVQDSDFVGLDVFSVRAAAAGGFDTYDDIRTITHELRIDGSAGPLDWMIGAYYSDEEIEEHQGLGLGTDFSANAHAVLWNYAFVPALTAAGPALAGIPLATGGTFGDVMAAPNPFIAFAGGVDSAGAFANNVFRQDGKSWSIFTHNTLAITDRLDAVVGLRWTDEKKDGSFEQLTAHNPACLNAVMNAGALNSATAGSPLAPAASAIAGASVGFACFPFTSPAGTGIPILPATFDETFEDEELIYTGKLVYAFTDLISGYLSFTHGFKAGGFNLDATAAAGGADPSFDSELIDAWEVGIKAELLDRRLRANLALFDYELEDFQVLEFTGVQFTTFNVPKVKSQGGELELLATPLAGLELHMTYAYADSRYPSDCDGNDPNAPGSVSSLCGATLTNSPEHVLTFGASYDGQIGNSLAYFLSGHVRWEDERRTGTQPDNDFDFQDDNTKVNLRLGIGSLSGSWTVELWGNNVTNEQTRQVTANTPLRVGSRVAFLEAPRTYGVTLRTQL